MKADTSVAVASVVRRRRMELIRRSSKLAVRTRLRTWVFKDRWQYIGPKTDPCGTSQDTDAGTDVCEWTETDWIRPERYDENQSRTVPERPKSCFNLWRRMLWSIVSKAADRSNEARREMFPSSKERRRSLTIFRRAVYVECPGR